MNHDLILMMQQEWFSLIALNNVPCQYHQLKDVWLLYIMLEAVKGLHQKLFYCVINNFQNHNLIIMTSWTSEFT